MNSTTYTATCALSALRAGPTCGCCAISKMAISQMLVRFRDGFRDVKGPAARFSEEPS